MSGWLGNSGALWLCGALLLALAELAIPGVFLIFLAVAAAITGVATLALGDLPIVAQLGSFAVWSGVAVAIGRRWYVDYPVESSDPMLNDRAARLIGQRAVVAEAISGGRGRVRIGDGEWPASGPDAPVGAAMRIVAVAGGIVEVEPATR